MTPTADYAGTMGDRSVCRHCGRNIVLHERGSWELPADAVPADRFYDDVAWGGCPTAPSALGFVGKHEPTLPPNDRSETR
jgi:hypothetical protein